jgi:O-antigen ligase/Tfp pilus assembly protein PilF
MTKKKNKSTGHRLDYQSVPFYFIAGFLLVFMPVFYLSGAIDQVLMPRLLLLNSVLFSFLIYLIIRNQFGKIDFSILRKPVVVVFSLYFLVTAFSLFFANNPKEGLFDFVKTFDVLVLVFLLASIFKSTPEWAEKLSKLMMAAGFVALSLGYYQYLTLVVGSTEKFLPDGRETIYIVKGLMAHKNQFSDYLMMLLPFLIYGAYHFTDKFRTIAVIQIFLILLLIILLQTRSVWAGIIISLLIGFALLLFFDKQFLLSKKTRKTIAIVYLTVVIIGAGIFTIGVGNNSNVYLSKLRSIINPEASNNPFRLKVWGATLDLIKDNPLTGVGAGNWQLEISKYLPDLKLKQIEMNWGRPHNDYLWVFAEKGVFGFVFYVLIFVISLFYAFEIIRKPGELETKIMTLLLIGGLLSYMVVAFFTFTSERIDHQVYFAIFITAIIAIQPQQKQAKPLNINKFAFTIPVLAMLLFGTIYGFATVKQEFHLKKAHAYLNAGKWPDAIAEGQKAKKGFRNIEPEGMPVDWVIGQAYSNSGDNKTAIAYFNSALKAHPYNFVVLNNLGKSYFLLGDIQNAKTHFEKALTYLPNFTESLVNLASVEYTLKHKRKAYNLLNKIPKSKRTPEIRQNINALDKELKRAAKRAEKRKQTKAMEQSKSQSLNEKK